MTGEIVRVEGLRKTYTVRNGWGRVTGSLDAVDGVDLVVHAGETVGVVGESGSGKSTLGRLILQIEKPTAGRVVADRAVGMQVIFQDPFSSLNPHRTALQLVSEPLEVAGILGAADVLDAAREALAAVGIEGDAVGKRPRAFSGGQRQRIAIARAIAPRPRFIVCDEPVSALDMQVQAQVTTLLQGLQSQFGLTYLFISHDLAVVREIADRTAVMRRGRIVELANTGALFDDPRHPYTRRLLGAVLGAEPREARRRLAAISARADILGIDEPAGPLREVAPGHFVAG
jgi:ABC-type oligopeptide transport system ATPase subunit